eukprot:361569-Chlamydomonas_euryale.AAC.10
MVWRCRCEEVWRCRCEEVCWLVGVTQGGINPFTVEPPQSFHPTPHQTTTHRGPRPVHMQASPSSWCTSPRSIFTSGSSMSPSPWKAACPAPSPSTSMLRSSLGPSPAARTRSTTSPGRSSSAGCSRTRRTTTWRVSGFEGQGGGFVQWHTSVGVGLSITSPRTRSTTSTGRSLTG